MLVAAVAVAALGAPAAVALLRTGRPSDATAGRPHAARPCSPVVPPAADVDGDGCDEAVRWSEGVLQAGTARFALGGPVDAWALGDWDCDGRRAPALLDDGVLTVFDGWPALGGELEGRRVATVAGATGVDVVTEPDGCDRPSLVRTGGPNLVVDARRGP